MLTIDFVLVSLDLFSGIRLILSVLLEVLLQFVFGIRLISRMRWLDVASI